MANRMNSHATTINGYLKDLVGKRCEAADNPTGSVLRLDIGPLGLGPHDEVSSRPHGWRHLTISSPWRFQNDREVLCDWMSAIDSPAILSEYMHRLIGEAVVDIQAVAPANDLWVTFSNGILLKVFADRTKDREDSWFILGTDGFELVAGPSHQGSSGWRATWRR